MFKKCPDAFNFSFLFWVDIKKNRLTSLKVIFRIHTGDVGTSPKQGLAAANSVQVPWPYFSLWHFAGHLYIYNIADEATKPARETLAATKPADVIKQIDTHSDRTFTKTNLCQDTRSAQMLCVSIFNVCFCADRSPTAQAHGQQNFFSNLRTLKSIFVSARQFFISLTSRKFLQF